MVNGSLRTDRLWIQCPSPCASWSGEPDYQLGPALTGRAFFVRLIGVVARSGAYTVSDLPRPALPDRMNYYTNAAFTGVRSGRRLEQDEHPPSSDDGE